MESILEIPDILIRKGLPFAIFSLPGKDKFTIVIQKENKLSEIDILDISDHHGFIFAGFDSAKTGICKIIKPDYLLVDGDELKNIEEYLSSRDDIDFITDINNISISKDDYLDRATYLIGKLIKEDLQKVVFSRVIKKDLQNNFDIASLLSRMRFKYKNAFINLVHIPEEGTWFGASPETLYRVSDNNIHTDALAGTKAVDKDNPNPAWSIKEKEEQYLVSLFIESLLSELGISDYNISGPITVTAGNIAHLQSKFLIPKESLINHEGRFIAGLHPTPAVCGLPKADAYLLIQKAEQHQRRYYTGFLGPWKLIFQDNQAPTAELFVNLRCAELGNNSLNIYVGGGLTASSVPEDEYQETIHKSQTLLSIVENL